MSLKNRRVLVMGLGRFGGGVGVTRWLCGQGAQVTVTDMASAASLAESVAELADCDITLHLGGHNEDDLSRCDLVVVNPAVPESSAFLQEVRRRGIPVTTEINLFLDRCPATVVGITGSVGKSTTTAMTGQILSAKYVTHVGGNIGKSLLSSIPDSRLQTEDLGPGQASDSAPSSDPQSSISPGHIVILELSSFQLQRLADLRRSPQVAAVTNISPNHLDWHGDLNGYIEAKKNIFRYQSPGDVLVLNADDPAAAAMAAEAPGRVEQFSADAEPFELAVPGAHNQANAQAAWAIGRVLGVSKVQAAKALREFRGLPNRLCLVAERDGVKYFDDSKATTPAAAMVALRSFRPGIVVAIVGGYDKKISLDEFAHELARCCRVVVTTGDVGPQLAALLASLPGPQVVQHPQFDEAVRHAGQLARLGEVVLLSPGCASYDQFDNYIQRGQRFAELVQADG